MVRAGIRPVTRRSPSAENRLAGIVYNISGLIYVAPTKTNITELAEAINSMLLHATTIYQDLPPEMTTTLTSSRLFSQ
jgi:hypothetical protein